MSVAAAAGTRARKARAARAASVERRTKFMVQARCMDGRKTGARCLLSGGASLSPFPGADRSCGRKTPHARLTAAPSRPPDTQFPEIPASMNTDTPRDGSSNSHSHLGANGGAGSNGHAPHAPHRRPRRPRKPGAWNYSAVDDFKAPEAWRLLRIMGEFVEA